MVNESGLRPLEYNLIVRMDPIADKTAGGVFLPSAAKDRDKLAADEGTVVAVSEHAFNYAEWTERKPQPGDRVLMAQFDGRLYERGGITYRIIKDKSVIAVVEQPAQLAEAA